jgi:ubiquinone/menaquinone biosynthesis C-methylase UbiE
MSIEIVDVGNAGERILPEDSWLFHAHASIYHFASRYVADRRLLDAGCGTGYGSKLFREAGAAEITAVDASALAIQYCKKHATDDTRFLVCNLCEQMPFDDASFDMIFSSNAMEHIAEVDLFLAECCRVLTKDGMMIAAVPPIVSPAHLKANLLNRFHVTNLPVSGWCTKLFRYFEKIQCFRHRAYIVEQGQRQWMNMQEEANGKDIGKGEAGFDFEETTVQVLNSLPDTLTAVFVVEGPREAALPPSIHEYVPQEWKIGEIFAEVVREETARAEGELSRVKSEAARSEAAAATEIERVTLMASEREEAQRVVEGALREAQQQIQQHAAEVSRLREHLAESERRGSRTLLGPALRLLRFRR